jgi:hypothetical protein
MKKIFLTFLLFTLAFTFKLSAQETVKVYCEVTCYQYNLFKKDVNALVDFGIADKAKEANGWIYNSENNKKYSFASPMSVFAYMAKRGWEYKDAIIVTEQTSMKGNTNVWHFILTKDLPDNYTAEDVIDDIDYRTK